MIPGALHHTKFLRATMTASLMLVALAGTTAAAPIEFFQNLFGSTQLEKGYAALQGGDYATATRLLRPLAEQGDAEAQYNLGRMYEGGMGVEPNFAEAVKWYRLAADQDNDGAKYNLARMYEEGRGVPRNQAEALKLYCSAANNGDLAAMNVLGRPPGNQEELCGR